MKQPALCPSAGRMSEQAAAVARLGSTQLGLTKWQVYPAGYFTR